MKKLQNLKGAKTLTKTEQKNVVGGTQICYYQSDCPGDLICTYLSPKDGYGWCLSEPV